MKKSFLYAEISFKVIINPETVRMIEEFYPDVSTVRTSEFLTFEDYADTISKAFSARLKEILKDRQITVNTDE